jgi:hypothetical protein
VPESGAFWFLTRSYKYVRVAQNQAVDRSCGDRLSAQTSDGLRGSAVVFCEGGASFCGRCFWVLSWDVAFALRRTSLD